MWCLSMCTYVYICGCSLSLSVLSLLLYRLLLLSPCPAPLCALPSNSLQSVLILPFHPSAYIAWLVSPFYVLLSPPPIQCLLFFFSVCLPFPIIPHIYLHLLSVHGYWWTPSSISPVSCSCLLCTTRDGSIIVMDTFGYPTVCSTSYNMLVFSMLSSNMNDFLMFRLLMDDNRASTQKRHSLQPSMMAMPPLSGHRSSIFSPRGSLGDGSALFYFPVHPHTLLSFIHYFYNYPFQSHSARRLFHTYRLERDSRGEERAVREMVVIYSEGDD